MQDITKFRQYVKPYIFFIILAPLMMMLEVAMDLVQPTLLQHMIDDGIAKGDTAYMQRTLIYMVAAAILGLVGGVGCSIYASKASIHFGTDLRQDVYNKIIYFSAESKDKFTLGKLITNLTNDVELLQRALGMLLKIFVRGPMLLIGSVVMVYWTARELFAIFLVIMPLLTVCIAIFMMLAGKFFHKVQTAVDAINIRVQESLAGIRVIKAFNRKDQQVQQFMTANDGLMQHRMRAEKLIGILGPLMMLIINLGLVAAMWIGAIKVEEGTLQVGVILAFVNYLMIGMNGLMTSSMVLVQLARSTPSAKRIAEILEEQSRISNVKQPVGSVIHGKITFNDVSFSYNRESEPVLKNMSFSIQAGETVGIIGLTGSGKSTLVKMIARLFDVDSGQILIDDVPIQDYDLVALRAAIGFAPQKATLFSKTIASNIRYGNEQAITDEIMESLQAASASEFVERLPNNTEHLLTQGATNLSGGQKQRLAMARAFVRQPAILILDDVTSAVDSVSEKQIQQAIQTKFAHATKLIVSSKISSIREADQIFVLNDGQIEAIGTHGQLLKDSKFYQQIAETQEKKGGIFDE